MLEKTLCKKCRFYNEFSIYCKPWGITIHPFTGEDVSSILKRDGVLANAHGDCRFFSAKKSSLLMRLIKWLFKPVEC